MLIYSWDDFLADARKIAVWARSMGGFEAVYGIPRGGLVLATYLSHALFLPLMLPGVPPGPRVLVVDDNAVTGRTIESYVRRHCATAVLVNHPLCPVAPSFFARADLRWPIFPWEADATVEAAHRRASASALELGAAVRKLGLAGK